ARRLALGGFQTAVVLIVGRLSYRALSRAVARAAGRWARPRRSWAVALTSAVALRASGRARASHPMAEPATGPADAPDPLAGEVRAEDLAAGLRRLAACAVTALGLLAIAWLWELDWALVRSLLGQSVWAVDDQTAVTVGDLAEA